MNFRFKDRTNKMQCRACRKVNFEESMDMSYVVPADGKTLYDYFNECTQLQASSEDNLPTMLCINCTLNLRQAYSFRQEALKSDDEFKKMLRPAKDEPVKDANSTEQFEDIGASTYAFPSLKPKNESPLVCDSSKDIEDIEVTTVSVEPLTTRINTILYDHIDHSDVVEVIDDITADPLSTSEQSEQTITHYIPDVRNYDPHLYVLKEEIEIEHSTNREMLEISKKDQLEEMIAEEFIFDDDKEENSANYDLKNRIYSCDFCACKCGTLSDLKMHVFEQHKDELICRKCSKVFELPKEMQLHEELVHESISAKCCPWCNNSPHLLTKAELVKHLQTKHNASYLKYFPRLQNYGPAEDDPFQCDLCQQLFMSEYELADHVHEHKFHKFDCALCSLSFKRVSAYKAHIKRIHKQSLTNSKNISTENEGKMQQFQCTLCMKQFKLRKALQLHMNNKHTESDANSQNDKNDTNDNNSKELANYHTITKTSYIGEVDKLAATTNKIETEPENATQLVQCKYCNREISSSRIVIHEKRHAYRLKKQRKYICSYCSREYKSESSVKLHEKNVHLCGKPEPKECPICQKKIDASYLKTHIKNVHTSERSYVCDICGDGFKSYVLLFNHKQLHLERKFACTICNKGFIRISDLKVHMRIHTGEEPYACHLCDRRFKIKVRLNYHLQRHAGIKRKCNVCGKEFNHVKQLKIHSYKHTGMPYRCPVCNYGCAQRDVFRKHLLRMHDMTMTDAEYRAMFKANTGRNPCVKTLDEIQSEAKDMGME